MRAADEKSFSACLPELVKKLGILVYEFLTVRTFFARVWWALFVLSAAGAIVYVLVVAHVWTRFVQMRAQYGSWRVASHIAEQFQPMLDPLGSNEQINAALTEIAKINPTIDVFFYQLRSKQLYRAGEWIRTDIDTDAVERFLNHDGPLESPIEIETLPLEGENEEDERSFSAARVSIDGEAGYVIVILSGQRYQKATRINRPGNVSLLGYSLFVSILLVPTILGIAAVLLVTLRFRKMTHVVAAFSKGDYTLRITDRSSDELGVYARAFDQMADTIVESMEALKVQDELRRQLIANVSHELRRPLSLMSLSLETLLEGNSSWSEQLRSEYIEQAIVGNEQMARLVADLFELSKLQASESPPHVETFELDELIDDVIAKFARLAGSKGLTLTSSSPEEIPHVLADLRLIDRVLSNLIENAIHHSPAGGEILITLTPGERAVEVRISDQGAGIPAEELPHIFERFYRGGQTGIQDSGGAGLGLAIVKRILEMHDQSISVESVPGEGCHFSFFLRYSETQAL